MRQRAVCAAIGPTLSVEICRKGKHLIQQDCFRQVIAESVDQLLTLDSWREHGPVARGHDR